MSEKVMWPRTWSRRTIGIFSAWPKEWHPLASLSVALHKYLSSCFISAWSLLSLILDPKFCKDRNQMFLTYLRNHKALPNAWHMMMRLKMLVVKRASIYWVLLIFQALLQSLSMSSFNHRNTHEVSLPPLFPHVIKTPRSRVIFPEVYSSEMKQVGLKSR